MQSDIERVLFDQPAIHKLYRSRLCVSRLRARCERHDQELRCSGASQGIFALSINPMGAITGYYTDANGVNHGFLRTP
jgi:hypothetical protein